jgi:hypothetical protein
MTQDKITRRYEGAKQQVIVTNNDVTGQNFELKPAKAGQADDVGDGDQAHVVVGTGH